MKKDRILLLAELLPAFNAWTESITDKNLREQDWSPAKRRGKVVNDPAFGFKFVRTFAQQKRQLPSGQGIPPVYFRALDVLTGKGQDTSIEEAVSYTHPGREGERAALEALLLCRPEVGSRVKQSQSEKSEYHFFEEVARIMGTSTDVILSYEALFFAVRARLDDPPYIASLVYPRGVAATRTAEFRKYGTHREKLFIAAWEKGWDRVLLLAGLGGTEREDQNIGEASRRFRSVVLELGADESEFGDPASPLIGHAMKLAIQDDSPVGDVPDSRAGLTALGRTFPIRDSIMKMAGDGIKEMLRSQKEEAARMNQPPGLEAEAHDSKKDG